ncbi:hypothetical protein B0T24DRAFT_636872 [Lasiosphaeria ovina]|uniref:Transmembrane protein n=1 Tax=Lasiosphaeria ovina TaxID=92902 RepID=A0AAE0N044_9PEZI|nr:hypothetical protein B0T24DRAFT_636872 [Lasiosphaeria ovina]
MAGERQTIRFSGGEEGGEGLDGVLVFLFVRWFTFSSFLITIPFSIHLLFHLPFSPDYVSLVSFLFFSLLSDNFVLELALLDVYTLHTVILTLLALLGTNVKTMCVEKTKQRREG